MTVALIFTKTGNVVEKVQLFMRFSCLCVVIAQSWHCFKDFQTSSAGAFFRGHGVDVWRTTGGYGAAETYILSKVCRAAPYHLPLLSLTVPKIIEIG